MITDPNDKDEYNEFYRNLPSIPITLSNKQYGDFNRAVVFNDYETFATKVVHYILSC